MCVEGSFARLHQHLREVLGWVSPGTVASAHLLAPSIAGQKPAQKPAFACHLYWESACGSHVSPSGAGNHFNCFQGGTDRGMCPSCWLTQGQKQRQGTERVSFLHQELKVNPSKPGDSSQNHPTHLSPHAAYCTSGVSGPLAVFVNLVVRRVKCWPSTPNRPGPFPHSAFVRETPSQPLFFFYPSLLLPKLTLLSPMGTRERFTALSRVQHPNKGLTNRITGLEFPTCLQMPARLGVPQTPPVIWMLCLYSTEHRVSGRPARRSNADSEG